MCEERDTIHYVGYVRVVSKSMRKKSANISCFVNLSRSRDTVVGVADLVCSILLASNPDKLPYHAVKAVSL